MLADLGKLAKLAGFREVNKLGKKNEQKSCGNDVFLEQPSISDLLQQNRLRKLVKRGISGTSSVGVAGVRGVGGTFKKRSFETLE